MQSADLDLRLLRTFVTIVDSGSLTAAGRRVGRSQPAITHQIKRLEQALGRRVFGPDRKRLSLTPDGEVLLDVARSVLRLTDEARARFAAPRIEGHVTIGTPDLYAPYLLPEILRRFSRSHPQIEIELRCTRSVHVYAALQRGELDLALMTDQPNFARGGEVVRQEATIWVAGQQGEPEAADPLPLALLPAGSVYRQIALDALSGIGRSWSILSVCDSIAGLQAAVFAGLAVSIFPQCAVGPGTRPLGRPEGLPPLPSVRLVLHRRQKGVSDAAEQLARFISAELGSIAPFARGAGARLGP